ncbi:hypothetical protein HNR62_000328 [Oceanisphaera litoralis]|uniref:DUF5983 family protein n=1 Tax=Oceanisphaera litoralis TaxID=225144 RepID=UPI0019560276|nr:hypothetical protein [Oceanisphaera litoralis]MBM7454499.1 hypothetical protein [Oceanisphaera litoralis]
MHQEETLAVLSTGHLTQEDAKRLGELAGCDEYRHAIWDRTYGYMLSVPLVRNIVINQEPPMPSMEQVLTYAHDNSVDWLVLDGDGPLTEELPQYGW